MGMTPRPAQHLVIAFVFRVLCSVMPKGMNA